VTKILGTYPTADEREQMGRFLRHAFPLGLGSFSEALKDLKREERAEAASRH
jgi:hypothetical protein